MENCAKCGKTIDKTPFIQCATCKATVCYECGKDKESCPVCGH